MFLSDRVQISTQPEDHLSTAMSNEYCWLQHCYANLDNELDEGKYISWSAYHASVTNNANTLPCLSALLPLFDEKAATASMIKHGMNVQRMAT